MGRAIMALVFVFIVGLAVASVIQGPKVLSDPQKLSRVNPAVVVENSSGSEMISLDHMGTITGKNLNLTGGNITFLNYSCDSYGNCYSLAQLNTTTTSYPRQINATAGTYSGNLTNGTHFGYTMANGICSSEFPGSHLCDEFEIIQWFANVNASSMDNVDAWMNAGAPKYIPATVPVNDCNGWMYNGTSLYLGNYWHFNKTIGGDGRALNCGTYLKLACCTY